MSSRVGSIHLVPLRAHKLKNVQTIGKQDPYIKWTLLPWGDSVKSKVLKGTEPVWEESLESATRGSAYEGNQSPHLQVLQYPGQPLRGMNPELLIEVFDAEVTRSDRIIGRRTIEIRPYLRSDEIQHVKIKLQRENDKDKNELDFAGNLEFTFHFKLNGLVKFQILTATDLNNKQVLMDQESYVTTTLLPLQVKSSKSSKAKGVNPTWEGRHKAVLSTYFDGSLEEHMLKLKLAVYSSHMLGKDSFLGGKVFKIDSYVTWNGPPDKHDITVSLLDENKESAGTLTGKIWFENEGFDASKPTGPPPPSAGAGPRVQGGNHLAVRKKMMMKDIVTEGIKGSSRELAKAFISKENGGGVNWQALQAEGEDLYHYIIRELSKVPVFYAIQMRFGIPRQRAASVFLGSFILFFTFTWFSFGTKIVCMLLGVLFPSYWSFKALETSGKDDDTHWLTYWVIYAISTVLEETAFKIIVEFNPAMYFILKMFFLAWLLYFNGSNIMYKGFVRPWLRDNEDDIDDFISKRLSRVFRGPNKGGVPGKKGSTDEGDSDSDVGMQSSDGGDESDV